MCEVACTKVCTTVTKIREKPSWKLENVVTTFYKTTSNINISNCLQMRYKFAIFYPWMIGWKSDYICQFNQINFPKISE